MTAMVSQIIGNATDWLFSRLCRRTSKKTSRLCATGHLRGESTGDRWIPLTKASNLQSVSTRWHHNVQISMHLDHDDVIKWKHFPRY